MKEFNKVNLIAVRAELSTALAAFEASNPEFKVIIGKCVYSKTSCEFKVEVALKNEAGVAQDKDRTDYLDVAKLYGMDPDWLDRDVLIKHDAYKLVGLHASFRKMPVILERRKDGKKFRYECETVIRLFGAENRE